MYAISRQPDEVIAVNEELAMRASDRDREQVVGRLRAAMEEGRLTTDEYVDRVGRAYQATTYGDLAALEGDLPRTVAVLVPDTPQSPTPPARLVARTGTVASLPVLLKVLWAIWLTAVSVNVVVWVLVSVTTGNLLYPWPLWVAGPYGAALFAVSAVVTLSRRPPKP
jgi:alkylated DNA nucleotide flippase Atl1